MKVKDLIRRLSEIDPESDVELRIDDRYPRFAFHIVEPPHESTRYFCGVDETGKSLWQKEPLGEYITLEPNTTIITNWVFTASYADSNINSAGAPVYVESI